MTNETKTKPVTLGVEVKLEHLFLRTQNKNEFRRHCNQRRKPCVSLHQVGTAAEEHVISAPMHSQHEMEGPHFKDNDRVDKDEPSQIECVQYAGSRSND